MSTFYSNHLHASLPPQKLSSNKKDKTWRENCVKAVANMGNSGYSNGRTSWGRKQINYDLVNSIFNEDDFKYVMDPYGQGSAKIGNQPAKMRDINLIVNKINLLKGEEMNRPFNFNVMAVNGEAVSVKEKRKTEMLKMVATQMIAKELKESLEPTIDPQTGEEIPKTFEEVDKFMSYSFTDIREKWGNSILQYLKHKEQVELKFNEGWEHGLIAAEEIYYIGIVNGEPKLRVCNPLNCEFDRNPDNPWIEDGDWFKEDRWMTSGQILDEFGEFLSEEQISMLDKGNLRNSMRNQMFPGFAYSQSDIFGHETHGSRTNQSNSHYLVTHVVWKSMKKIGFVTYQDEFGDSQTGMVDETFKLSPEMAAMGYTIEWRWLPEIWHGTKIGDNIIVAVEPMPNQSRSMDNPSEVKLPYIGRVYNATNSIQTSLVDLIKPHQYLYNVVWFRLEAELAKAKGKKFVMDIAQIPKSEGIDLDKWMYFFDNVGIAFINSFEEGKDKFQGQVSQFNQFQAIDVSLSQSVGQYITILSKIESLIDKIIGITPQREGAVHQSETAQGVERAVTQSSHITEPWFYIHNEIKKRALTSLLETAKFAYPESKKIHYILNDVERIQMEIDMEKFSDSDYGVFVTNSTQDYMILQKLQSLVQQGIASGAATFSDAITMFKSNSVAELSNLIKQSEQERQALEQQQQQIQAKMQQDMIQAQAMEKEKERAFNAEQNQLDRENELRVAALKVTGFDTDTSDNGRLDAIEEAKLQIDQLKESNQSMRERDKLNHDSLEKDKDRQLKREEIASKEKIEKLKAKTALKNKTSGEK